MGDNNSNNSGAFFEPEQSTSLLVDCIGSKNSFIIDLASRLYVLHDFEDVKNVPKTMAIKSIAMAETFWDCLPENYKRHIEKYGK